MNHILEGIVVHYRLIVYCLFSMSWSFAQILFQGELSEGVKTDDW